MPLLKFIASRPRQQSERAGAVRPDDSGLLRRARWRPDRDGQQGRASSNHRGEKYEQKIEDGDNVCLIARRLTMQIYRSRNGDMTSFNRPLNLPPAAGWR